jgi:hypothetical protein
MGGRRRHSRLSADPVAYRPRQGRSIGHANDCAAGEDAIAAKAVAHARGVVLLGPRVPHIRTANAIGAGTSRSVAETLRIGCGRSRCVRVRSRTCRGRRRICRVRRRTAPGRVDRFPGDRVWILGVRGASAGRPNRVAGAWIPTPLMRSSADARARASGRRWGIPIRSAALPYYAAKWSACPFPRTAGGLHAAGWLSPAGPAARPRLSWQSAKRASLAPGAAPGTRLRSA